MISDVEDRIKCIMMQKYNTISIINRTSDLSQERSRGLDGVLEKDIASKFLQYKSKARLMEARHLCNSISLTHLQRYHGDYHQKLKWYLMNYSYQNLDEAKKEEYKTHVEQIRRANDNVLGRGENENLIRWIYDEIHGCSQFCQVYNTYALE